MKNTVGQRGGAQTFQGFDNPLFRFKESCEKNITIIFFSSIQAYQTMESMPASEGTMNNKLLCLVVTMDNINYNRSSSEAR